MFSFFAHVGLLNLPWVTAPCERKPRNHHPKHNKGRSGLEKEQLFWNGTPSSTSSRTSSRYSSSSSTSTSSRKSVAPRAVTPPPIPGFEASANEVQGLEDQWFNMTMQLNILRACHAPTPEEDDCVDGNLMDMELDMIDAGCREPCDESWGGRQHVRDRASLFLMPTQSPRVFYTPDHLPIAAPRPHRRGPTSHIFGTQPEPIALQRVAPSVAVKKRRRVRKEVESVRDDRKVLRRARRVGNHRWEEYNEKWAAALVVDAAGRPTLKFTDIPWPVLQAPLTASHITPVGIHQFMVGLRTDPVEWAEAYKHHLSAEVKRWHPDKFDLIVLPLVVPHHRAAVKEAATRVLEILIQARDDNKKARTVGP